MSRETCIKNTILVSNDIFRDGYVTVDAYNTLSSYSDWDKSENTFLYDSSEPLFTNAAKGDYTLAANSQAIDKGNNTYAVDTEGNPLQYDLAGNVRIVNKVDIGAYEFYNVFSVTTVDDIVDANDCVLSLREAIAAAQECDIIKFDASLAGKTITLNGSDLLINKTLTINASLLGTNGITISGGNKTTLFNISGGSADAPVTLINLTLTAGKAKWYGGILVNTGYLSVQDTSFLNGTAYYGGAISNNGTLSLDGCSFTENQASYGGAIYNRANSILTIYETTAESNVANNNGGFLYSNGVSVDIDNSNFTENLAKNRGGVFYFANGTNAIHSSIFTGNTAKNYGGTIYNAARFNISGSTLSGGSAIYGGAIANTKSMSITNCEFSSNSATKYGGAIYASSSIETVITGGVINGNSANQGGGIYVRIGTVKLNEVELSENSATHSGGAIYNGNQTILTDCVLSENFAKYYGGAINNQKVLRLNGSNLFSANETETAKSPDIYTKEGGTIVETPVTEALTNVLFDSIFEDENEIWI